MAHQRNHVYEVRPAIGGPPVVSTTVDRTSGRLTILVDGNSLVLDVVAARAVWITIHEAVYEQRSLVPDGPTLTLECDRGNGRPITVRRDQ